MLTLLDTITGFIAPHQCIACGCDGAVLCDQCIELLPDALPCCYRCRRFEPNGLTCVTCRRGSSLKTVHTVTYYEGVAEALVRGLKFGRTYAAAEVIARALAASGLRSESAVLVPVPTARNRVRQRGYDQSVLIARSLAKHLGLRCESLLYRHGSQRQTGSSRAERIRQLEGAFTTRDCTSFRKTSIILVDDVMTTGATLEAAARVLRSAGVRELHGLTFARAA